MTELSRPDDARRAAHTAARASYGRLIAMLASRTRDIAGAEDALGDAFAAALATWPARGVPDSPEAWLLTAARRNLMHDARHRGVEDHAVAEVLRRLHERAEAGDAADGHDAAVVDKRLELLFVCAHPAIDPSIRTPLMLQAVLGLDAERIASAFLVAPAAMGQRLVRAKTKIKQAGLRFEVPAARELPERLDDVLRAVYVAFGAGWEDLDRGTGLTEEAIYLGRTLVHLMPREPEAKGLLSLMLHCEARRDARRDDQGRFVPLPAQDPRRWTPALVVEAEQLLAEAAEAGRFGRFQCEAAIQSVHAQRAITGVANHAALKTLYDLLLTHVPSIGAAVARAAVLLDAGDLAAARDALDALDEPDVRSYQPFWVTRARIAEAHGDRAAMRAALVHALGLTEDPAVRRFLEDGVARCEPRGGVETT